jgi:hypothetical protein
MGPAFYEGRRPFSRTGSPQTLGTAKSAGRGRIFGATACDASAS